MRVILAALAIGALPACHLDVCSKGDAQCAGNVAENCFAHDGNAMWIQDPCDASCVVIADHGATCVLSTTPDPACPSQTASSACIDNTAVSWTACYRTSETPCTACIDPSSVSACSAYDAFCAQAPDPDPLCGNDYAACADSTTLVKCFCGYRTDTEPCPSSSPTCAMTGNPLEGECEP